MAGTADMQSTHLRQGMSSHHTHRDNATGMWYPVLGAMEAAKKKMKGDLMQAKDPGLDVGRPRLKVSFIKRPQKSPCLSLGLFSYLQ